jgi:hypothetical protein
MNVIARPPAAPTTSPAATSVTTAPAALPAPSTLAPANFTELVEFAEIAARSQFVPKDYRNHPEDILLAVQLGKRSRPAPDAGAAKHRRHQRQARRVG